VGAIALRPYQSEAEQAILAEWDKGNRRTLLVLPTGCGKTIVFSKIIEDIATAGKRTLVLAHRGELLDQAADKLEAVTGLKCAREKAEDTCLGSWYSATVGSVQTLMRETRLSKFPKDFFDVIVVDEAHHCLADGYQRILDHFSNANVLGVTATPDRGDMRNLGQYFDSLAYEYTLPKAIHEGYLCPIVAQTIPLKLDLSGVGVSQGDFKAAELGTALDPYLYKIADEMAAACADRKTIVFLPLIKTSQKFCAILRERGFAAVEVNGESRDRKEALRDFEQGKYNVLCNSMLVTEGYDCPPVDCIVVLRPTKIRSLYAQMVGRGSRLFPGKKDLLLLDFLWNSERHELCRPACLIATSGEVNKVMVEKMEEDAGGAPVDLIEAEAAASEDVVEQRERKLAEKLGEMRHRKRRLVDPLQYAVSISAEDLTGYVPAFGWEMAPISDNQRAALEKAGIFPDDITNAGMASKILDRLRMRRMEGLATPKQIRFLEGRGFHHVGTWQLESASAMIVRMKDVGWRIPHDIDPSTYQPARRPDPDAYVPFYNESEVV
jgi:superfamily II DNA or RNA helicase